MAHRTATILERVFSRAAGDGAGLGDAELLRRFVAARDEAAFELLVWRYGALVLGVCRRAVRDEQLAEDAFQAVFLVLARKAGSVRAANLGGWLFRVARRVAARAVRNRPPSAAVPDVPAPEAPCPVERGELAELLDAEIARLPDRLRRALILCYLGGRSAEEAARELGCPRGTILSRLAAARKRLGDRLTRRGVTLTVAGGFFGIQATGRLVSQTVAAARNPFPGPAATGPAVLAESVVCAMANTKLATACGALLLAAGLTLGVGWVAARPDAGDATAPAAAAQQPKKGPAPKDAKPEDKAVKLRKQAAEIASRIEDVQHRLTRQMEDRQDAVDVGALESELFAIDKDILIQENQAKIQDRTLASALKNQEEAPKRPVEEREIVIRVNDTTEAQAATQRLQNASGVLSRLKQQVVPDSPVLQAANKDVADATAALKDVREKVRPEVEKAYRVELERNLARAVEGAKNQVEVGKSRLAQLHERRQQLVARIAVARQREAKRQVLEDELRVLRGIQMELLRQQTLAELGIEGVVGAPVRPEVDPAVEVQINQLRREVEALRAELQRLKK